MCNVDGLLLVKQQLAGPASLLCQGRHSVAIPAGGKKRLSNHYRHFFLSSHKAVETYLIVQLFCYLSIVLHFI